MNCTACESKNCESCLSGCCCQVKLLETERNNLAKKLKEREEGYFSGNRLIHVLMKERDDLREALEYILKGYLKIKELQMIIARSDSPNWMPGMTAEDDIYVQAVRKALTQPNQNSGEIK